MKKKFSDWYNKIRVKTMIAFSVLELISFFISAVCHLIRTRIDDQRWIEILINCENILIISWFVLGGIVLLFMLYTPDPDKPLRFGKAVTKPKEFRLNKYKILNEVERWFKEDKFIDGEYDNSDYKIKYYIKEVKEEILINLIINEREMTEKIFDDLIKDYFKVLYSKIVKDLGLDNYKPKYVTIFVQVKSSNEIFQKYITRNVYQSVFNYILPIGIDLNEDKLFIPTQDDGYAMGPYNYMKKQFIKKLKNLNILEEPKK